MKNNNVMKRFLPLFLTLTGIVSMSAQEVPGVYPGLPIAGLSPNGQWAVSDPGNNNPMVIIDFTTGNNYSYKEQYAPGSGNRISNTGVAVGSNSQNESAAYWENGSWKALNIPAGTLLSYANGVTPDASRIVGNLNPSGYTGDYEGLMQVPCYWDRQADGTYAGPFMLPYPTTDFTGRKPQYVTAVRVSENGKIIAGQMRDYLGMICQPVMYYQDEAGNWEYKKLLDEVFNGENFDMPPFPGEAPSELEYMTPEQVIQYEQALRNWELTGNGDYELYPDYWDYMTPENYQAYLDALTNWDIEYSRFDNALWDAVAKLPNFSYNNVLMTSDGKYYATTDAKFFMDEASNYQYREYVPYLIDVENGTYKKFPSDKDINIMLSSIGNDGTLLGQWNDPDYGIYNGFILPVGKTEFITIYDFMKEVDAEQAEWMNENMTHEFEVVNVEDWTTSTATTLATGIPFANPDLTLIGFMQNNFWEYPSQYEFYGYLLSLPQGSGVEEIGADSEMGLKVLPGGDIYVSGEASSLEVYNLNGMRLLNISYPTGIVSLPIDKGIYIIRLNGVSGESKSQKIVINN